MAPAVSAKRSAVTQPKSSACSMRDAHLGAFEDDVDILTRDIVFGEAQRDDPWQQVRC